MQDLAVALDLGGTQIRAALVDRCGAVLRRTAATTASSAGPDVVIGQLGACARTVMAGVPQSRMLGVGLAAPGPLDAVEGVALAMPNLAGFANIPLRQLVEQETGLPAWLENDGIAAAIGEWRFGAGRGHTDLVYITVSTGIGGGVICDGRVLRGRRGMAGHIGHMTIERDGAPCACGNLGCWEAYASGTAFGNRARSCSIAHQPAFDGGPEVFKAALAGNATAIALVAEQADLLGVGIASLFHLYSPGIVIVGGGMAANFDALLPGIRMRLARAAMPPFQDIPIVRAARDGDSGLIGAAWLVFDGTQPGSNTVT